MGDLAFDQDVSLFLATCRTACVATCDASLGPHAANVQFVSDAAWRLYWVSSTEARHSRDLAHDDRAAVTIYGHDDRAEHIHGLQMHGHAAIIGDPDERRHARSLYVAKFAFILDNPALDRAVEAQAFYRLTPAWLRWIDNRRGFGWKRELTVNGRT
jgi:uncharacterized protein YhbP (UPF0306 family)